MKRYVTAAVLFAAVAVATAADDDKAMKELNGSYTVKSFSKGGMDAPEEVVKGFKSFIIKDGTIAFEVMDKMEKGKFTIDASKKPAHIDVTPTTGPDADTTWKGIYKLEKGKLTICLNHKGDRPKDFDDKGEEVGKIVLEKKKAKK
jgi:uncharacterized protein (TIGR03067 family)